VLPAAEVRGDDRGREHQTNYRTELPHGGFNHMLETKGSVVAAQDQLIVPKASHGGCLVSLSPARDKETEDRDNNGRPCSASYSTGLR